MPTSLASRTEINIFHVSVKSYKKQQYYLTVKFLLSRNQNYMNLEYIPLGYFKYIYMHAYPGRNTVLIYVAL